jgi:hypothetical protein
MMAMLCVICRQGLHACPQFLLKYAFFLALRCFSVVQEECRKYGDLLKVVIPRPTAEQPHPVGLGKVIIEYTDMQAAVKARNAMHGRKFGGHVVAATYLQEEDYASGEYNKSA